MPKHHESNSERACDQDYSSDPRPPPACRSYGRSRDCRTHFPLAAQLFEFLRRFRVAEFVGVEIYDVNAHTMFYFAFAEIMQVGLPMLILLQILGDTFRKQNVSGISAVHHPLRHVNSGAGNVRPFVDINDTADRAAVHAHSQRQIGMCFNARLMSSAHSTGASGLL